MIYVGENIKYLRSVLGLSQQGISEKTDIKRSSIGAYEENRATPPVDNLVKLSRFFNVSIDDLITKQISKSPYLIQGKSPYLNTNFKKLGVVEEDATGYPEPLPSVEDDIRDLKTEIAEIKRILGQFKEDK